MSALPGKQFASESFSIDRASRVMISEASDLHVRAGDVPFAPIYDDACDVGCTIQGKQKAARFYLAREEKDREGDVSFWEFKPTTETLHSIPGLRGWTVLIFND